MIAKDLIKDLQGIIGGKKLKIPVEMQKPGSKVAFDIDRVELETLADGSKRILLIPIDPFKKK